MRTLELSIPRLFRGVRKSDAGPKLAWNNHLRAIAAELAGLDGALKSADRQDFVRRARLSLKRDLLRSGLFDAQYYLDTYADVRRAGIDPLDHYIAFGAREGRTPNRLFDPSYYCATQGIKVGVGPNPLAHYIRHGEAAGLKPGASFDPRSYLAAHPDVAAAGVSPFWHHLHCGALDANLQTTSRQQRPIDVHKPALRTWVPPATGPRGVNFIGPVEVVSGLGTSARGYVTALEEAQVELNVVAWRSGFEHQRRGPVSFSCGRRQPISILHLNADSSHLWLPKLAGLLTPEHYRIAIWYWELPSFRPEWIETAARFDEIWCASSFAARSIAAVSTRPVRVVRPALAIRSAPGRMTRRDFALDQGRFIFFFVCDVGSNLERKNPLALVRAFIEEFRLQDGAALLLKLNYPIHDPEGVEELKRLIETRQDVVVIDQTLTAEQLSDLWSLIDCYVSPHRSEGLGLTVIEAMLAGKPVIATPYGGVVDFLRRDTAILLDYGMVEIGRTLEPYPAGFVWADPKISSIRSAMRRVFSDRAGARALGEAGRHSANVLFSVRNSGASIKREIDRIWAGNAACGAATPDACGAADGR